MRRSPLLPDVGAKRSLKPADSRPLVGLSPGGELDDARAGPEEIPVARLRRMCLTRLSATPACSALRFVGLLVVVGGLFGMHGLASHGVEGMDVVSGTARTSQSMAGPGMGIDVPPLLVDRQEVAPIDPSLSWGSSESGQGGMDVTIAMMCVAILGAALITLLRQLRVERSVPAVWARPHQAPVMSPASRGLAPPSLIELSIQRC